MKVLHVVGDSRYGGAGRIITGLACMAGAEGWEVEVLTTDPIFQQEVRKLGLGLLNLDVIRRNIRPAWDLSGLIRLSRVLKREAYDIVHTHTSKGGFVGRLAASLANVPVIVHTLHGFAFHEQSPRTTRFFCAALERIAAAHCDRIVSVSDFHRQWAVDLRVCEESKIVAIRNGICDPPCRPAARTDLRRQLELHDNDVMLLNTARLAPGKGLEYLIEAAALLPTTPSFRFFIAGDGPHKDCLVKLTSRFGVTDRIRFLGYRDDISDLLAAADIVVLPSLREGLSIALLEAMSSNKPIIASRIGSHVEVVAASQAAELVPPADAKALRNAILSVSCDRELMAAMGARARMAFESHYTERRMLEAYRQLYWGLLERKCGRARPKPLRGLPVMPESAKHSPLDTGMHGTSRTVRF